MDRKYADNLDAEQGGAFLQVPGIKCTQSKLSLPPHKRPCDVDTIKKLLSMCWYMKIKMINQLFNHSVACSDDCSCAAGCDLVMGGEL